MPYTPPFAPYKRQPYTPPSFVRRTETQESGEPVIDVTPTTAQVPEPLVPSKPSLDQITIRRYSQIVPAEFVQHKLIPKPMVPMADVEHMEWYFDEPEHDDDHEVRLYVALSAEDIATIKRWGYQHDTLEKKIPLFDTVELDNLIQAQHQEIEQANDPHTRAALSIEHNQQLEWARQQFIDITILDYLASPYRKQCENRYQTTIAQRQINGRLAEFKTKLEKHRDD